MSGQLNLVSVGPGSTVLIPPLAQQALERSDAVVGYGLYLQWIQPWLEGKEIHALPLTQERDRAALALKLAREGRTVSLVSSGDIGVYGLAPLVFEMLEEGETTDVRVIPGITAALSCASVLGAPLGHDFATLSLSDLLCPWPWIESRARLLAQADVALVLYNVQSQARQEGVYRILDILLASRSPDVWCGIVRNAYREDGTHSVCTLGELRTRTFDMLTTLVIGTRFTKRNGPYLYAPRGYHGWATQEPLPPQAVWFFTGTRDGNQLAAEAVTRGVPTVISVATEHGAVQARKNAPGAAVVSGRLGEKARRELLLASGARAVVDATHPFATQISPQLVRLCEELHIPYLRYERPSAPVPAGVQVVPDMATAAREALNLGKRVFLATGLKDLTAFTQQPDADRCQWFARVMPAGDSLQQALAAGIPAAHLCAMQGPFSQASNEVLWRDWHIDCVVTKDSGEAGGLPEKIAAAHALGITLLVVQRPTLEYPASTASREGLFLWLKSLPEAAPGTSQPL